MYRGQDPGTAQCWGQFLTSKFSASLINLLINYAISCIMSVPGQAIGCLAQHYQCVHVCIVPAHTKHSLKSLGMNGRRSKAQGQGLSVDGGQHLAVAPPTLQAASQVGPPLPAAARQDGIAWGPKLWALLCAVHTNHTQAAIQRHEKAQERKPLWSQVLINSPRQFLQDKGRGMLWHKIHQTFTSNLC